MQEPAQKPKKRNLLRRMRDWLHRGRPRRSAPVQSLVILPRQAALFSGRLMLSLPQDFRPLRAKDDSAQFFGKTSGLHLTAMQLPFSRRLHSLSIPDIQEAFRQIVPPESVSAVKKDFLRHSQALTAEWNGSRRTGNKKTVLRLIQVRNTVFLLLFENITPENESYVAPMIFAASVSV
ncbi:MAG: hypothetical protein IJ060_04995 [Oscillospiraceae bacterium]|nr:hypothetical protein [Oscillospiraceae bacterium]